MTTKAKINLYDLDSSEMEALITSWGEPSYRARQIWVWLYKHLAADISEMTSLSKALREKLSEETTLYIPPVLAEQESLDGETRKDLLQMVDGEKVEVVLMHYINRDSACLSTQVGCALGCKFCATGQMGFVRNLTSGEIVSQALHVQRALLARGRKLTNIVLMGMGEPLNNYDHTLAAMRRFIDPEGFQFGQRRITLSTAGVVPGIRKLAREGLQVNLAISLHAATDALRTQIMPINKRYPLDELFSAVNTYIEKTNRRVTFEWALMNDLNDTMEQAEALAARIEGMLAHVNLIPLNPTGDYAMQPSAPENIEAFTAILDRHHINYTVRLRRGIDIQAGCGQLRRRESA